METARANAYGNCSFKTSQIIDILKTGVPGETIITDEELGAKIGLPTCPGGKGYSHLIRAINIVRRDFGLTWKRVRSANAIKCLGADEVVSVEGRASIRCIRRRARRASQSMSAIDLNRLDDDTQREARAMAAQIGTIAMFSAPGTTKKLETRSVERVPDQSKVLEMFK